ncbi:hypothetical protein S7711_00283 [Stachybotrys chartarum IBT 7711]|uniref:Scytalone dehydratase-like domain-containing protein n=1 Tax=Stachybotrys chartarum (strain CBS 109288 / IBT 7711) TaxID=1280523 RepID=A0A084B406_STACB|nr:hypothetical protein S7711_00283 [Stachybotrys chartarum IBT 7711]KFA54250.1 hypothetical protein S40293_07816 [Stachybotrys chartarum IBT 40293]KFA71132.1 hypothetical protein S40288_04514 [Stachybotrys chartarum IBT 40288]
MGQVWDPRGVLVSEPAASLDERRNCKPGGGLSRHHSGLACYRSKAPDVDHPRFKVFTPALVQDLLLLWLTVRNEDVLGCQEALYEWAESYDTKDWDRLANCVAPVLRIDYRAFMNALWEAMPADEFVQMASNPHFLGNKRIKTQHFVGGAVRWIKSSETEIVGRHQMRVAHQKYDDDALTHVAVKGHGHGMATVWYRRVDDVWKFAGIEPGIRWSEYDHDKIFQHDGQN